MMTDYIDSRRPNLPEPFAEDSPPGTLEEIAPGDPENPLLNDESADPGIPVKDP